MTVSTFPSILALSASLALGAAAPSDDPPFFTGKVVNALTGRPLAGALIDARLPTAAGATPEWTAPAKTDAIGRFTIPTSMVHAATGSTGIAPPAAYVASASGTGGGDEDRVRADGRIIEPDGWEIRSGIRPAPTPSASRDPRPLAKQARVQGGPPYRVRMEGFETRENRMWVLVLDGTIRNGGFEPDTGLVIPLVPLHRPDSRVGP